VSEFVHEALLYADEDEFLRGTVPFLEHGLRAGEPMLVAVGADKIAAIVAALGRGADRVQFTDMARLGANPAQIIPAWHDFVAARDADRPLRGIGEPIWAGRSTAELIECQRHESLLNLAFATTPAFRLLCPYDTRALPAKVIDEARRSHPRIVHGEEEQPSDAFRGLDAVARPFAAPMPEPPAEAECYWFDAERLPFLREVVAAHATLADLSPRRARDLAFAVNEVTTNSVRHAGGSGVLRMWTDDRAVLCEVRDVGRLDAPLAGRLPPTGDDGGWGLWLANQLCDLVQLRSYPAGSAVRLHMQRP
jgi:anti-sigma regulatory factor (Ser/Thr protein kinase)